MINIFSRTYWESAISNGASFLETDLAKKTSSAVFSIRLFYFLAFYLSIKTFSPFSQFPQWDVLRDSEEYFRPLWSVFWIEYLDWELAVNGVLLFFFIASLFGIIFWNRSRIIRLLVFLSMFVYLSLISSFGTVEHWMHIFLIVSFLLVFIPSSLQKKSEQKGLLMVVLGIQSFILFVYFLSGSLKLFGVIRQEFAGLDSSLDPSALAEFAAMNSYHHNREYYFTSFVVENPSPFFSMLLFLGMMVELMSIYIIFKPRFHGIWGLLLILLHGFILLFIGPDFTIQILVVATFILFSPFRPIFYLDKEVASIFNSRRRSAMNHESNKSIIIYYDGDCITCHRFLKLISNFEVPENTRIAPKNSAPFESVLAENPVLSDVDSIVIIEQLTSNREMIRFGANSITWFLPKVNSRFIIVRVLYWIAPFIGNLIYNLIAASRQRLEAEKCPIPPSNLKRLLQENNHI